MMYNSCLMHPRTRESAFIDAMPFQEYKVDELTRNTL
jgi:hypothetical protein